jgi:broad specificity phosphatase PhoE
MLESGLLLVLLNVMKKLFYVRHGETEYNVNHIWSGQVETKLTDNGKYQAKQAGKDLSQRLPHIDLIISSPFERTYHTASIIAEEIGYPIANIQKNELFIERSFGVLDGTSNVDYHKTHTFKDIDHEEGVETVADLHERAEQALKYLMSLENYETILVVSHGAFGRALQRVIKRMPHTDEYDDKRRNELRLGNAEIVELL